MRQEEMGRTKPKQPWQLPGFIDTCAVCGGSFTHKVLRYRKDTCSRKCVKKRIDQRHGKGFGYKDETELCYGGIHTWVKRNMVKSKVCDFCGKNPGFGVGGRPLIEWANVSHGYHRDKKDWICLCVKCHRNFDQGWKKRTRDSKGHFIGNNEAAEQLLVEALEEKI